MKLLTRTLIIAGLLLPSFVVFASQPASAAACANTSEFGTSVLQVPKLPSTNDRVLWVRMQAPNESSKVLVEVNEADCLEIGGYEYQPGTWAWQAYRDQSGAVVPLSFDSDSDNVVKVIGVSDGVKVDRILITDNSCLPVDFGNNCQNSVSLIEDQQAVTALLPPSNDPVSGKVRLSQTPEDNIGELKQVSYTVNGQVVQTSNAPEYFDTTLIGNGKHTVYITTKLADGNEIREMVDLEVKNPQNAFSPIVRWLKLNKHSLLIGLGILISLVLLVVASRKFISGTRKRRERKFWGM